MHRHPTRESFAASALCLTTVTLLFGVAAVESQLFPFHNLLAHGKTALAVTVSEQHPTGSTLKPDQLDTSATQERPSRQISSSEGASGETSPEPYVVQITPRPKYKPQAFVSEPVLDPNHSGVPSIFGDDNNKRPKGKKFRPHVTSVESVPALSVVISAQPQDNVRSPTRNVDRGRLADYLLPPKYPSYYDKPATDSDKYKRDKPTFVSDDPKDRYRKPEKKPSLVIKKGSRPSPAELEKRVKSVAEQITSETISSGQRVSTTLDDHGPSERVEFQMHGQAGPASYKFGYDTGKGKDRQFRFEEKDEYGHVKGQYGYYDNQGNLKVVNYQADQFGFRAQPL